MKKILSLLFGAILLAACGNSENVANDDDTISKCLMAKDYKYEELLTKADIAKHIAIDEASYEMEISPTKGEYGSCTYKWLSDRPDLEIEILGQTIQGPDKNFVVVKMLDFYTDRDLKLYSQASAQALFDQSYKKLSQQEYNELLGNLEKEYANDASQFEKAKGFLDARMNFKFEPVEGLGDRAYWKWHDTHGIELVVLAGATRFTIENKTSGDQSTALAHAVKFAEEVLAKCGR